MQLTISPLPETLKPHFWDIAFDELDPVQHQDFIIRRILIHGDWNAITWLRAEVGDPALASWLIAHKGGRLNPRQLRFWEVVLDLSHQMVTRWIRSNQSNPWASRST